MTSEYRASYSVNSRQIFVPAVLTYIFLGYLISLHGEAYEWIVTIAFGVMMQVVQYLMFRSGGWLSDWDDSSFIDALSVIMFLSSIPLLAVVIFAIDFPTIDRLTITLIICLILATRALLTGGFTRVFMPFAVPLCLCIVSSWTYIIATSENPHISEYTILLIMSVFFCVYRNVMKNILSLYSSTNTQKVNAQKINKELNLAIAEAERANLSKTRFLASASHDLRQPLHILQLLTSALSMQKLDPRASQISDQIEAALKSLAVLMDGLLDISKIDAGVIKKTSVALDLVPFIDRIASELKSMAIEKGLTLCFSSSVDSADTLTDGEQLERVIRNLIGNAIKYTNTGGSIEVTLNTMNDKFCIEIRDTGVGIAESELDRVFEEFYQINHAEQGLGLGLAIVKHLTSLLDVPVHIDSELGVGTRVSLALPQLRHKTIPQDSYKGSNEGSLIGVRVLCVDDQASVRNALREIFDSLGSELCLCKDIDEVLERFESFSPDIILADLSLGEGRTGIEAIQSVRKTLPDIPALLISGDTAPERLRMAEESDITLLHKPLNVNKLKSEILLRLK